MRRDYFDMKCTANVQLRAEFALSSIDVVLTNHPFPVRRRPFRIQVRAETIILRGEFDLRLFQRGACDWKSRVWCKPSKPSSGPNRPNHTTLGTLSHPMIIFRCLSFGQAARPEREAQLCQYPYWGYLRPLHLAFVESLWILP